MSCSVPEASQGSSPCRVPGRTGVTYDVGRDIDAQTRRSPSSRALRACSQASRDAWPPTMTHVQFSPGVSRSQKASPISTTSAISVQEPHRPEFQLDGNAIDLHRGARCEQALSIAAGETGHVDAHAAAVHLEDEGVPNHPLDFPDELDP